MILLPECFHPSSIRKGEIALPALLSINKISFIIRAIPIIVDPFSVLFAIYPHALIGLPIKVSHLAPATLEIVFPFPLIQIAIGVVVLPPPLLTIFDSAFEALAILEDVDTLHQHVFSPVSKIHISRTVKIYP
jgi:hypothetical protein